MMRLNGKAQLPCKLFGKLSFRLTMELFAEKEAIFWCILIFSRFPGSHSELASLSPEMKMFTVDICWFGLKQFVSQLNEWEELKLHCTRNSNIVSSVVEKCCKCKCGNSIRKPICRSHRKCSSSRSCISGRWWTEFPFRGIKIDEQYEFAVDCHYLRGFATATCRCEPLPSVAVHKVNLNDHQMSIILWTPLECGPSNGLLVVDKWTFGRWTGSAWRLSTRRAV